MHLRVTGSLLIDRILFVILSVLTGLPQEMWAGMPGWKIAILRSANAIFVILAFWWEQPIRERIVKFLARTGSLDREKAGPVMKKVIDLIEMVTVGALPYLTVAYVLFLAHDDGEHRWRLIFTALSGAVAQWSWEPWLIPAFCWIGIRMKAAAHLAARVVVFLTGLM